MSYITFRTLQDGVLDETGPPAHAVSPQVRCVYSYLFELFAPMKTHHPQAWGTKVLIPFPV